MITRAFILIILVLILPDIYLDRHLIKKQKHYKVLKRILWWMPSLVLLVIALWLTTQDDFIPQDPTMLYLFLFFLSIIAIPKTLYSICAFVGSFCRKKIKSKYNLGKPIGIAIALYAIYVVIWGVMVEFYQIEVKHVEIISDQLPKVFDGYKIVHFSDAHVGSYRGKRRIILEQAVDSMIKQHADMIVFTGDLQNARATETKEFISLFKTLKAKDGVYSVLGNHDYSEYMTGTAAEKLSNEREIIKREKQYGWTLLRNQHHTIYRGKDSIVIAGEENGSEMFKPNRSDLQKTLQGVNKKTYTILLQHDPIVWRKSVLPHSHVQLTLCGHTHGGQINLAGLKTTLFSYPEDHGLYMQGKRALNVSAGLGGSIPIRYGVPGEISVITLRSSMKK